MSNPHARYTARVLRAARQLLADPARWCRGSMATDEFGQPVEVHSLQARRWCAAGAVQRVGYALAISGRLPEGAVDQAIGLLLNIAIELGFEEGGVGDFNDRHSHKKVMALFDTAIAVAEAGHRQAKANRR